MRIPARENNDSTVTPPAGGKKVPLTTNRYRPFNVARVHVVACSFSSVYPCSTVRSPTLISTTIPVAHRPIRFVFICVSLLVRIPPCAELLGKCICLFLSPVEDGVRVHTLR